VVRSGTKEASHSNLLKERSADTEQIGEDGDTANGKEHNGHEHLHLQ